MSKTINPDELSFPDFEDIKVSTKTFTTNTNLVINIKELFNSLPITEYIVIPKKRGRRRKGEQPNPNKHIKEGSIITIKCEGELRGVEIKPKKPKASNGKKTWFRNSITVVIILDKPINFKVCKNGTFQMTGCTNDEHAERCVQYVWDYIKDKPSIYSFKRGTSLETLFIPSMRNIDFSLGFIVDREALNRYMSEHDDLHCLLETTFGYTGVNIKIPLEDDIRTMKVKKMVYDNDSSNWVYTMTTYEEYLQLLTDKERDRKIKGDRYNTFLVFHSGKVIMSGLNAEFMRDKYYDFLKIIRKAYEHIKENLDDSEDESESESKTIQKLQLSLNKIEIE